MDSAGIWITIGWIIDIILNGIVWFIIGLCLLPLIDVSDKWTRKAILFMDKVDKWIRNLLELSLEWMLKKNLRILIAFIFIILFGLLAQFEIIPKIIK
jgi:hypothetical protein|tara:strand:+ start:591 stop:884 length:294 start_codon:yes stop_codon:yes gene_type:complete